ATLNFLNAWLESSEFGSPFHCVERLLNPPPERSPRQCIGPSCFMPRSVCVVIGPLSGWKSTFVPPEGAGSGGGAKPTIALMPITLRSGRTNTLLFRVTARFGSSPGPSGAPRSHASESKSPNVWHTAHEASPLDEVRWVS